MSQTTVDPGAASGHPPGFGSAVIGGRSGFDPGRAEGGGVGAAWRSFSTSVRLGWAMESNWTDPVLFFIYSVAKPVSAALILVVMLEVIGGASTRQYRGFVVTGSALWAVVVAGIAGLAWSILEDRERYRMIKYVYVSPSSFLVSMAGRALARAASGGAGAIITLALGVLLLGISFDPFAVDWLLLAVVTMAGAVAVVAVGMLLGAIVMQTRQEAWQYPEAVAGAMFLVSGAVFPLAVLPMAIQAVGLVNPLTWWLEGTRTALFPGGLSAIGGPGSLWTEVTGTSSPDSAAIVVALYLTTALGTLAATLAFRASERRAKDRGLLDQTTGS
jgi:ABC-2 type transport system permease protein